MNKKLTTLFTGLTLIAGSSIFAQTQKVKSHKQIDEVPSHRTCGTMENFEFLKATRPNYEKEVIEYNNMLEAYIKKEQHNTQRTAAPITVPVVIHILYQNATENISDLRATEQVTVLNEDFQWCWDDSRYNKAKIGDFFAFYFHGMRIVIHKILDIKPPSFIL